MKIKKFIIGLSCIFLITTLRQNVEAKKRVENEITHNFSKAQIPSEAQQWNDHFYMVYDLPMEWDEAKEYCENMGGHLITITTQEEQDFINSLDLCSTDYWMGASDAMVEGDWEWITKEKWKYENWHENQPDNNMQTENYLVLVTSWDNEWNDAPIEGASSDLGFICEWEKSY